jgi:hypothetical protein
MTQIRLTEEQARTIAQSLEPVQICDDQGNVLGILPPIWRPDDVAEAKRRLASDQPRHSTAEVLEHLRARSAR